MNFLVAVDSFKECISSKEIADTIESAILEYNSDFNVDKLVIADGGEGTLESLIQKGGSIVKVPVFDALYRKIESEYGLLKNGKVIIELAKVVGLGYLNEDEKNPLKTSTYGVGELINHALNNGHRDFLFGIGGSSTNDGGIGLLKALGYRFLDKNGNELKGKGEDLISIYDIDTKNVNPALKEANFLVACDVNNPMYGKNGASYTFARQKGANDKDIEFLDRGLENYSNMIKKYLNKDVSQIPGSGAAGGVGAGFMAFLNAKLISGIELILQALEFENLVKNCDLVITGEGRLDSQSLCGKTPVGVANLAKKYNKPVVALAGGVSVSLEEMKKAGIDAGFSIIDKPMTLKEAMDIENTKRMLKSTTKNIISLFLLNYDINLK